MWLSFKTKMKKVKIYLLLIINLSLLFSCVEETEVGNEVVDFHSLYKKVPVVSSHFTPDSIFFVEFSSTGPAFNRVDSYEITKVLNPVIKDLSFGTYYPLEQSPSNKEAYIAKTKPVEGRAYQIEAEFPEFEETYISAIDTIPHKSSIRSVKINPEGAEATNDWLMLVTLEISPSSSQKSSGYEISVVTTITDSIDFDSLLILDSIMLLPQRAALYSEDFLITKEDYYPSILQFDAPMLNSLYFTKENTPGTFYIDFYYSPPTISIHNLGAEETITHIYSHSATIFLRTVSSNYYQYSVSRLKQFNSRKGDALYGVGEPVNVFTNIKNGTGIFASYTCDSAKYNYNNE